MTDEERMAIATAIAEKLPQSIVESVVSNSIDSVFRSVAYAQDDAVKKLVFDAVVGRAKELLRTKYAERIEKEAEILAARVATELPKMELRKTGY